MRTIIQRVKSASVTVDGELISTISKGLLIFAAIGKDDTPKDCEKMARDVLKAKLWDDPSGEKKWKKSVTDIEGEVLCVSQFTLLASTKKGHPSFHRTATPVKGKELYDHFINTVRSTYEADKIKDGVFQARMDVALVNDGPVGVDFHCVDEAVTIQIDTDPPKMDPENMPTVSGVDPEFFKTQMKRTFEAHTELLE